MFIKFTRIHGITSYRTVIFIVNALIISIVRELHKLVIQLCA
jgi:hypothetical protein